MSDIEKAFNEKLDSIQAAVDDSIRDQWGLVSVGASALQDVINELKKLQAENAELKKQSKWISVDDELPEEGVVVALYGGDIERLGLKTTAGFHDSYYRCFQALLEEDELELCDACFWMPLPTPPEGE